MIKKILLILFLWMSLLIFWYIQNSWLPLWYDHGAYKHFVNLLAENQNLENIPTYLKYQFEPFSGTFFYVLTAGVGAENLYGYGYLFIFILTWVSLFLLWKKKGKYTLWSYLGLFLFLLSSLQFMNLWWAFGKQIFATFFLLLLMRYYKNAFIAFLLMTACLSLHRLTGFLALLYFGISFSLSHKKNMKAYFSILIGICVGILSYLVFFGEQVIPYLRGFIEHPQQQIFLEGKYGTWFGWSELLFYFAPILFIVFFTIFWMFSQKNKKNFLRLPAVIFTFFLALCILFRSIAHTRMWSFLDLFFIILITRYLYVFFHKKWMCIFLITQCIFWWIFVHKWHTPFLDKFEYSIIRDITQYMPENTTLVTMSGAYMSWITGYTNREIYSLHQWVWQNVWSYFERKDMRNNSETLCKNLSRLPGNVIVYVWAREKYTSLVNNTCIKETNKWKNWTRLFLYLR